MIDPPRNIRALSEQGLLSIQWNDASRNDASTDCLPFKTVRGHCPCAACVDEITGVRTLDIESLPDDVHPTGLSATGNYAVKFTWSDGHDTGLYTWEYLKELADGRPTNRSPNGQ